jgi:urease beta subunit
VIPGEWFIGDEPIEINAGRRTALLAVRNTGDRPIQIGSHFHFFEVNRALDFDRGAALGMRLNVPSGQSVRFEAGDERDVELVELGGARRVIGFSNLVNGATTVGRTAQLALERAARLRFSGATAPGGNGNGDGAATTGAPRRQAAATGRPAERREKRS